MAQKFKTIFLLAKMYCLKANIYLSRNCYKLNAMPETFIRGNRISSLSLEPNFGVVKHRTVPKEKHKKTKSNYSCYRNHWLFRLSSSRETRVFITRSHFGSFFLTSEWRVRTLYGQAFKCSDTFAFASNIHSVIGVIAVLKNHCWNVKITGYSSSPKISVNNQ